MALTPLQTAQNNWERRANIFAAHGIAPEYYTQLYNRDMESVYSGKTGMSDEEVFSGIQSAVGGAAIQDPTAQHGSGSVLSGIADTLGNIPHDISGIITGFPAGIAHTAMHLPSEVTNTGELLWHLANGDNAWLTKKGYLQPGDQLHESWKDFGTILRAMDSKGSQQLLPYMPFLSDMANLTNGAGRTTLMQHPIGALLDVLPGIVKVGKLSVAGRDFSEADRTVAGMTQPRFYAAGRALQAGNPIKAMVSAVGDVIPGGKPDEITGSMTLRARANLIAKSMGFDRLTRESVIRPFMNAKDAIEYDTNHYYIQKFGDSVLSQASPERLHYLYLGTHGINPDTGEVFASVDEYATWVNSKLSPEERGGIDAAKAIVAEIEARDQKTGVRDWVPSSPNAGSGIWRDMYSVKSPVYKAYAAMNHWTEVINNAVSRGDSAGIKSALAKYTKAQDRFYEARFKEVPEAWNPAVAQHIKNNAISQARATMQGQELDSAIRHIKTSPWNSEMVRLFGQAKYDEFMSDAVQWWQKMAKSGFYPLWTQHIDPHAYDAILNPSLGRLDKPTEPSRFRPKAQGVYFGSSVHDIALSLTAPATDQMRATAVATILREDIMPKFTVNKDAKIKEFAQAVMSGGKTHYHPEARIHALINKYYDDFNPKDFGIRNADLGMKPNSVPLLIDKDVSKALKAMMDPRPFQQWGGNWVRSGTSLYKFSVLTGPRHLAHVAFGGLMFMLGREPFAVGQLSRAARIVSGKITPEEFGLKEGMLSGLRGKVYQIGPHHQWHASVGAHYGEMYATDLVHQAAQAGKRASEFIPNKLARLEETIMDMYRVSAFLSAKGRGLTKDAALEQAHKVFVDINGMSLMERTMVKQLFPFYAFTRHLFRYLFQYPVDYPIRAAIVSQFGEGEQADWTNQLPRSMMSLFFLGQPDSKGNITAIDLKNLNPFRSFANDFSFAGFFSSLSPFLTGPLAAIGVDTLSGTTQLYPGTTYNPQTGTLQATPPPGGIISLAESFVPQVGLLDHFLQLSSSTRYLAKYDPLAYRKQIFNLLNVPFVPEVINVPYQKEITEMRRFRAAQASVTLLEQQPNATNVAKAMEWNLVPWDNELVSPAALAVYYQRSAAALAAAGSTISPKAVTIPPPKRPAILSNF